MNTVNMSSILSETLPNAAVPVGMPPALAFVIAQTVHAGFPYPPEHAQVCDMSELSHDQIDALLGATPVGDVWGVGRRIGAQLIDGGVATALDFAKLDPASVKRGWSVVLERTVRELQGVSCIGMEDSPQPKKEIACTRSFGSPVEEIGPLIEAVSEFASRAAEKLRGQGSHVREVLVFIRTSLFRKDAQYSRSTIVPLRRPSDDISAIVQAAVVGLRSIYRPGFKVAKAGVMLLDLAPASRDQFELDLGEPESERDRCRLMQAVDAVNDRWGRGVLKVASGKVGATPRTWGMKQDRKSPDYTTFGEDMPVARA